MTEDLAVLYVGSMWEGSTTKMRFYVMNDLCHKVTAVDTTPSIPPKGSKRFYSRVMNRLGYPIDHAGANRMILSSDPGSYDMLWVDVPRLINAETLIKVKRGNPKFFITAFIMDNPFPAQGSKWKRFQEAIPFYDIHFVIRDDDISKLKNKGAKHVIRYHKGYDSQCHRLLPSEEKKYDVFFAGRWEKKRESDIAFLIQNGISITVAGINDWKRKGKYWDIIKDSFVEAGVYGQDYTKALNRSKIALCFYSCWNKDLENSRMYEIPACGTFMLAERNCENVKMFEEGREAEFFSTQKELLEKVQHYLAHPQELQRIAAAGRERCLTSGYSYNDRLKSTLKVVCELKEKNA